MNPGPIVCATRGGEASRSTQEHAIALAKERGAALVFLYVADCEFAGSLKAPLLDAVRDELVRLGQSLLSVAQRRAARRGINAQPVVLCGRVRETIHDYLVQTHASTLVLGASGPPTRHRVFTPEEVLHFAESVAKGTGAEVHVVTPEGKVLTAKPTTEGPADGPTA